MKLVAAAVVAAAVLLTGTAFAAAPKQAEPKKETLVFGESEIRGDFVTPGANPVLSYRQAKFASLLKTRADFNPELEKSVDGL